MKVASAIASVITFASLAGSTARAQVARTADRRAQLRREALSLPDVRRADAERAADAVFLAETPRWPGELLLAMAWNESRLRADVTAAHGRVCGPMQTLVTSPERCALYQIPLLGFLRGVTELDAWAHDRRAHGDVRLVLMAYACGNSAFDGSCTKTRYVRGELALARRLGYDVDAKW